jgi:hypothetical protein
MSRPNPSPYSAGRDSNAAGGNAFADEATADDQHHAFTAAATAADQLPTAGGDQRSQPTPTRFTYPWVRGAGGRLAD